MVGKLSDMAGVLFDQDEIAKHLKHKFLEWDFAVSKVFGTFRESRRVLSTIRHSGRRA
jgi:hypothetical protein